MPGLNDEKTMSKAVHFLLQLMLLSRQRLLGRRLWQCQKRQQQPTQLDTFVSQGQQ